MQWRWGTRDSIKSLLRLRNCVRLGEESGKPFFWPRATGICTHSDLIAPSHRKVGHHGVVAKEVYDCARQVAAHNRRGSVQDNHAATVGAAGCYVEDIAQPCAGVVIVARDLTSAREA